MKGYMSSASCSAWHIKCSANDSYYNYYQFFHFARPNTMALIISFINFLRKGRDVSMSSVMLG